MSLSAVIAMSDYFLLLLNPSKQLTSQVQTALDSDIIARVFVNCRIHFPAGRITALLTDTNLLDCYIVFISRRSKFATSLETSTIKQQHYYLRGGPAFGDLIWLNTKPVL